jgi:hypothetical protein
LDRAHWRAIWKAGIRRRRSASTLATCAGGIWRGLRWGREERSRNPALPWVRKRATHLRAVRSLTAKAAAASFAMSL